VWADVSTAGFQVIFTPVTPAGRSIRMELAMRGSVRESPAGGTISIHFALGAASPQVSVFVSSTCVV
jgi:hypothetical protein